MDVAADSPFCSSVAWMKGRNVTLGCSGGAYCPDAHVSRLAMAAFMQRLGDALSPKTIVATAAPGALDFASGPVVRETAPIPPAAAPRRAVLDAVFSGVAGADSVAGAHLVVSEDDGVSWQTVQVHDPQATFEANAWRNVRANALHDMLPYKSLRYGLRMERATPAVAASVADSTCRLRVRVDNGTTPAPL